MTMRRPFIVAVVFVAAFVAQTLASEAQASAAPCTGIWDPRANN